MAADGPKLIEVTLGSAATAWCRTATSCALSGAHSSTRPVRGELCTAPRPAASEHERSGELVTLRSEENVYVLSQPLAQLAGGRCALSHIYKPVSVMNTTNNNTLPAINENRSISPTRQRPEMQMCDARGWEWGRGVRGDNHAGHTTTTATRRCVGFAGAEDQA